MKGRFAVIIGHDQVERGAKAVSPLNCFEYEYNSEIARLMEKQAEDFQLQLQVFDRNKGLLTAYKQVNEWALFTPYPACAMELHFNSTTDRSARGAEVLWVSKEAEILAELTQTEVLQALYFNISSGIPPRCNRGAKQLTKGGRGYLNLSLAKVPAVIVEPFFGSNQEDCWRALGQTEEYARGLLCAAENFLKGVC